MTLLARRFATAAQKLLLSEQRLLADVRHTSLCVPLPRRASLWGDDAFINTVVVQPDGAAPPTATLDDVRALTQRAPPIVLVHGFGGARRASSNAKTGRIRIRIRIRIRARRHEALWLTLATRRAAGVAFWFKNLQAIADLARRPVVGLDLLGFGRSARPRFPLLRGGAPDEQTRVAEAFFVDSLRAWFDALGIARSVVVGHSLGGFLAALFAAQHAALVERLVLASPVGVPAVPPADKAPSVGSRLLHSLWNRGATPQALLRSLPARYAENLTQRIGSVRATHTIACCVRVACVLRDRTRRVRRRAFTTR